MLQLTMEIVHMTNLKCFINTALETKFDLSKENIKTIEEKAFAGDAFIEVVQLPDTINEIQTGSFENCTKLKSIVIGSIHESQKNPDETVIFTKISISNYQSTSIEESEKEEEAQDKAESEKVEEAQDKAESEKVEEAQDKAESEKVDNSSSSEDEFLCIEYQSFKDCNELRTIVILKESKCKCKLIIEKEAFSGCTNLRTLYISSNFKDISISDTAFEDCSKLTIISKQDSNSEIARYAREHKIRFINA